MLGTNTLTVDEGGGGDYTTLKAAFDFIIASGNPSGSNRWRVIVVSDLTVAPSTQITVPTYTTLVGLGMPTVNLGSRRLEVGNVKFTVKDIILTGTSTKILISSGAAPTLTVSNVSVTGNLSLTGGRVSLNACDITGQVSLATGLPIDFTCRDSTITNATTLAVSFVSGVGGVVRFVDTTIQGGGSGNAISFNALIVPATLIVEGGSISTPLTSGTSGLALSSTIPTVDSHFTGVYIFGFVNAVSSTLPYADAPFSGCTIVGGTDAFDSDITLSEGNTSNLILPYDYSDILVDATAWTEAGALAGVFEEETVHTANSNCAAYAITSLGSTLYFGVCNEPATDDGGVIVSTEDGQTLTAEITVTEQGIHDMHSANGYVWVPGVDPIGSEEGSIYTNFGGSWVRKDNLTDVVHVWGLFGDDTELLASTSLGEQGRIYESQDGGDTWSDFHDINLSVRAYDIVVIGSRWWSIVTSGGDSNPRVRYSNDGGANWTILSTDANEIPDRLQRFLVVGTDLYYVNELKTRIYKVTPALTMSFMSITNRPWGYPEFNGLVHDGTYFYWIDSSGFIWRANSTFTVVNKYSFVQNAISLYYWASDNSLIVSDKSISPTLWRVAL